MRQNKTILNTFCFKYYNLEQKKSQQQPMAKRMRLTMDECGALSALSEEDLPQWVDELRCVICTEIFVNPYAVNGCGHTFCLNCIAQWLHITPLCPICRHHMRVVCNSQHLYCYLLLFTQLVSQLTH
jgi:hypothetical protein